MLRGVYSHPMEVPESQCDFTLLSQDELSVIFNFLEVDSLLKSAIATYVHFSLVLTPPFIHR